MVPTKVPRKLLFLEQLTIKKGEKKTKILPCRESNPGRVGESHES